MAREILFRGISEKTKRWVFGGISSNCTKIHGYKVIPDSIGQFTGLTDKNGVKIYEGDIIRVRENKNGAFVVKFKNQYIGGWVLEHSEGELSLGARKQDEIEVIGNVFEHPELIEV